MDSKSKSAGFTLLELVIVISIIFLLLGLSANLVIQNNFQFVYVELEKLYAFALFLQRQAQLEKKTIKLFFDINNQKYSTNSKTYRLSTNAKFGIIKEAKGPPSKPVIALTKPITFKGNTMIFYPDGTVSSGVVYFTDKNHKVIYALSSGISNISYLRRYKFIDAKWVIIK